jgi:hypothetical protein
MEVFKIAVLATKRSLHVEAIVQCCTGIRSSNGYIIAGKVLDVTKKPCLLIINRGTDQ